MKQISKPESPKDSITTMPTYVRKLKVADNGANIEFIDELTPQQLVELSTIAPTPDNFLDAVNSVPSVDMVDKFTAMDKLSAAIAGIKYEKPVETFNVQPTETPIDKTISNEK